MKFLSFLFTRRFTLCNCALLASIWLLIGCTPSQVQEERVIEIATRAHQILPSLTPTTIMLPKDTPAPSPTPTSTFTPTPFPPTLTPIAAQSPTFMPTLTYEEEGALLEELMYTNQGCQLPCWWGINLGDTLPSIGETFMQWGIAPWQVTASGDKYGYIDMGYYKQETGFYQPNIFAQFYTIDGTVQYMKISGSHESRLFGEEEFIRDWQKYFLPTFLQTYGKPDLVYLRAGNPMEAGSSDYELLLYYPELGINISYIFRGALLDNGLNQICFALNEVMLIQLYLYNPQSADYWPVPRLQGLGDENEFWLIENMLDIDLDTFYQTYQDPSKGGCVEVPK